MKLNQTASTVNVQEEKFYLEVYLDPFNKFLLELEKVLKQQGFNNHSLCRLNVTSKVIETNYFNFTL